MVWAYDFGVLTKHSTDPGRAEPTGSLTSEDTPNLAAAIEERDVAIASLERTLTEQQAHVETLRDALERAKFQTRILEQSCSTQLGEARERAAVAEQSVADLQTRIAALEASHENLTKQLAEARAALDSFGPDAAPIDEMLASLK